jgi:hypothetical protein
MIFLKTVIVFSQVASLSISPSLKDQKLAVHAKVDWFKWLPCLLIPATNSYR